ncbi:MAG: hypothetical protein WC436_01145 [Candidatus Babeliales bacterium]
MKYIINIRKIKNIKITKFLYILAIICAFLSANQFCCAGGVCSKSFLSSVPFPELFSSDSDPVPGIILGQYQANRCLNLSKTLGAPKDGTDSYFNYINDNVRNLQDEKMYRTIYIKEIILANCNGITGTGLAIIGKFYKNLETINLANCPNVTINGILPIINNCKKLRKIQVSIDFDNSEILAYFRENKNVTLERVNLEIMQKSVQDEYDKMLRNAGYYNTEHYDDDDTKENL